ncbi:MAG TPA: response regulator [Pyrinomonadaceae bacterium]|nr:response regulator [Pyrinomonadaceae bacterium]
MISREEALFTGRHTAQSAQQGNTWRILLAEDDRSFRRYLEIFLKRAGYEVLLAADGQAAIDLLLGETNVDIVVTDAIMPNLNGYQLCRFLKETPQLSHLPVVLLSALEPQDTQYETRYADAFLVKPVANEELLGCLDSLLSQPVKSRV